MPNDVSKRGRVSSFVPSNRGNSNRQQADRANGKKPASRSVLVPRRNGRRLIAVFGSSRAVEGDELYSEAWRMGASLAQSGFDVMTGGYAGVMEAASRGAHEAGAHVVGITIRSFGETLNPYVIDELPTRDFYSRFRHLVDDADGYVVMRGGMGTLAELTFTWQKLWLKMLPPRPCALVGGAWRSVLDNWLANLTVERGDYNCLAVVDTPEEVSVFLRAFFESQTPAGAVAGK